MKNKTNQCEPQGKKKATSMDADPMESDRNKSQIKHVCISHTSLSMDPRI